MTPFELHKAWLNFINTFRLRTWDLKYFLGIEMGFT